jgi:hypothetical protein
VAYVKHQHPLLWPNIFTLTLKEDKAIPLQALDRPLGFQEVEDPRFQDNRHMEVVRLSALRAGRLYIPKNIPGTHFC